MKRGPYKRKPLSDRFPPKVDASGGPDDCWPFIGSRDKTSGYGKIAPGGDSSKTSPVQAHRVAYCLANGIELTEIKGLTVRHSCDNRICCNPAHLSCGSTKDNMDDAISGGRAHFQNCNRDQKGRFT